jgi:hypothetical protein
MVLALCFMQVLGTAASSVRGHDVDAGRQLCQVAYRASTGGMKVEASGAGSAMRHSLVQLSSWSFLQVARAISLWLQAHLEIRSC